MKLCLVLKRYRTKIGLLLAILVLVSCNALKKVDDGELLLTQNTIYADSTKVQDQKVKGLLAQKPNTTLLGYPLRLNLYNLAKDNPDSLYHAWLERKPKREQRLNNFLSAKQKERLGQSFFVKGYSNFFKRIGEVPAVIDTAKTRKSLERLEGYYGSKGYFNNTASYEIVPGKRKKRASLSYYVDLGNPYYLDSVSKAIASPELDSIFTANRSQSLVNAGDQFDLAKFSAERQRITKLFRNSGVYNFQESSVKYTIERDTSLVSSDQKMNIRLNIRNRESTADTVPLQPYTISRFKKINIFADYQFNSEVDSLNSVDYKNYTIYFKDKLKYKPKALTDAIFLEQDSIYSDLNYVRTNRQINNLNTFKYPSIKFDESPDASALVANIFLAPRPKYSLDTALELSRSNIQLVGTAFNASVVTRNVFGGAENLSLSVRGSIGLLNDELSEGNVTSELGGDLNLVFPRIWFPINTENIIPYYMLPQTRLSIGANFQRNLGLDRETFNTILGYNWSPSNSQKNSFELINLEFVNNSNEGDFFRQFNNTFDNLDAIADGFQDPAQFPELANFFETVDGDDPLQLSIPDGANDFIDAVSQPGFNISEDDLAQVRSIRERQTRLTQNNLIFTSNFTYQKDNKQGIADRSFYQYRIRGESAGNVLALASNIIPFEINPETGQRLVFGVPFSQYLKADFDFIKHWRSGSQNVLAFHSFVGLAVPYGNADNIPFVRSYFAGGSNDNRAWNVYSLGPGRTQSLNDFNEANFKLAFNLEYRFPIVGDIKGALFADAGNIWNVFDNVEDRDATFNGFGSLGDLALGTGFGLRYDFTYFIFRADLGLKTYNPALDISDRWFTDFKLSESVFNIGINYPF